MRRRRLWRAVAIAGLCVAAPPRPAKAADSFSLVEIKPGVFAAIARPGDGDALGNAGFVVGSDAVLVVDSFATPRAAEQLLARIRRQTPLPIRWLVNTHYHLDHCGGNSVLAKAGAVVVAQENARSRMREAALARAPGEEPDREKRLRLALPSETYRDALSIWLGGRRVDVFSRPGHTDGDSLVSVPDADVLFGGDLLQKATVPNLADAKTDAWIKTLDELAARFPTATLVPGHGAVARPIDMRPLRDYLVTLRLAVARELQQGKSGAALSEAVLPRMLSQYRSWSGTEHIAETVTQMETELKSTTTAPAVSTPTP